FGGKEGRASTLTWVNRPLVPNEIERSFNASRLEPVQAGRPSRVVMAHKFPDALRVLVVEDEAMITVLIEDMLTDLGCVAVGPAYNAEQAFELIRSERFDAAVLDINLAGERTTPVAEALHRKDIPFFFATGYGRAGVAKEFGDRAVLNKPFTQSELVAALESLF